MNNLGINIKYAFKAIYIKMELITLKLSYIKL